MLNKYIIFFWIWVSKCGSQKPISAEYPHLNELIQNIWETMQAAYGVGLAASQVGLPIRLFVVDSTLAVDEEKGEVGIRTVFINAEAISQ